MTLYLVGNERGKIYQSFAIIPKGNDGFRRDGRRNGCQPIFVQVSKKLPLFSCSSRVRCTLFHVLQSHGGFGFQARGLSPDSGAVMLIGEGGLVDMRNVYIVT